MIIKSVLKPARRAIHTTISSLRLRAQGARVGNNVRVSGRLSITKHGSATIEVGDNVVLNSRVEHNSLEARGPVILKAHGLNSQITIGNDSGITSATLSASYRILIGERVLIGAGVLITDSDHHVVRPPHNTPRRFLGIPKPQHSDSVIIEDDVFIGARSIILKGVHIGRNAVVGAGSVVTSDVPANAIAAGNPARVVGQV